jgi:hypothetical protein
MVRRFDVRIPRAFSDRGAPPKPAPSEPAPSEPALSEPAPSEPALSEPSGASLILLDDARAPAPDSCACCGALAARAISVGDGAGRYLLVGYCDDCAAHVSRTATRRWSALCAGALLGGSLAAGLPVALPWSPWVTNALFAIVGALLVPFAARALERPRAGHSAAGPAVFFRAPGELICRRPAWAEDFARRLGVESRVTPARSRWLVAPLAIAALAAVAALILHRFHHPTLRILNLGEATLELFVDGRALGRVLPSSAESPSAGLELRLPAGRRVLEVRKLDGHLVDRVSARVFSGSSHLYAPASPDTCFWLEARGYGRDAGPETITRLEGEERFWTISNQVRGWFSPNPPSDADARATGGTSIVLRQAPCAEAP